MGHLYDPVHITIGNLSPGSFSFSESRVDLVLFTRKLTFLR